MTAEVRKAYGELRLLNESRGNGMPMLTEDNDES